MILNSKKILFFNCMVMGVTMSISGNSWIIIWMGLELGLLSFIPLMNNNNLISSESSIKYFLIQSISSCLFMFGFIMVAMNKMLMFLIMISMLMKMGVAPFHLWVLMVIEGLLPEPLLLILTIIKIPPIVILSYISTVMDLFIYLSMLLGSMGGILQCSVRKMIGYSSIFNMSFILSSLSYNLIWIQFFLIYSITILMIVILMKEINLNYINQSIIVNKNMYLNLMIWILFLSLGGFPPFPGFFAKLMIIQMMSNMNMFLLISMLMISSLMVMFFYLNMCLSWLMIYQNTPYNFTFTKSNKFLLPMISLLMCLPMILYINFMW